MDRTVSVTGQGTAAAVPDSAVVRVAVVQRADTVSEAFAGVASGVDDLFGSAVEFTHERRIASRDLNVWPAHDNQGERSGFEARHALEIGCADPDAASALLEALVEAVGDRLQVESVSLEVSDQTEAVVAARAAAYDDAVARATHLAGLAGAHLGPVVSVTEGGAGGARPTALRAAKADMSFAPGESTTHVALQVTWLLAP
ncbi:SIMPL domain-containing protein [Nocardioides jensenii]|uniref:SIMPL domain-containing protein n=1 Tax=Nocardioides jensenii TaxID=1843 RepID=UPI00082B9A4B|nr:SIMPL domain-containing protein [Nocardioides jensenii]